MLDRRAKPIDMASVFTFDPDPPRVASPWPAWPVSNGKAVREGRRYGLAGGESLPVMTLADCGITRLEAEPQEGPTEYKLHLLLRPRRSFTASSTVQHVSGSYQSKSRAVRLDPDLQTKPSRPSTTQAPSSQSRQNRLQNLTTQLLWRLQQSSPHHSSSKSNLRIPVLPQDDQRVMAANGPGWVIPGVEESQGALYEIGVSDDGAFVGLTEDELRESLATLHSMASSLGCTVEVLRTVVVGDCQWTEEARPPKNGGKIAHRENLFVVEALVTPNRGCPKYDQYTEAAASNDIPKDAPQFLGGAEIKQTESRTEQLRISLTGGTMSGKSSLLGTLSTSTLDNGRGKSRLSLLKHRHEIASGVSSSVTPELIGYHDNLPDERSLVPRTDVINYASGNVSSWNDIHGASEPGRLIFFTDSAGHPRYRRTTVRGLVSWQPHWAFCCIAADGEEVRDGKASGTATPTFPQVIGSVPAETDFPMAHLQLCLKLKLPLVVIITKLDLASKPGLRQTLQRILSILKSGGRRPCLLPTALATDADLHLQSIAPNDTSAVNRSLATISPLEIHLTVPIVLTSTLTGTGIGTVHALLRHLPIPFFPSPEAPTSLEGATILFHIDEVFSVSTHSTPRIILSGHLQHGPLSLEDHLLLGPFPSDPETPGPRSHLLHSTSSPDPPGGSAWHPVRVSSLRNLRLPVRKLLEGQVGTVGIAGERTCRVRKGMVLLRVADGEQEPVAFRSVVVALDDDETTMGRMSVGALVVLYVASVRAAATVGDVRSARGENKGSCTDDSDSEDGGGGGGGVMIPPGAIDGNGEETSPQRATFRFVTGREWIARGARVLVLPAAGHGGSRGGGALDGSVGTVLAGSV